jgi:hypothetical protein
MKILIIKSLLTSLFQMEEVYPLFSKEGKGRFFDNELSVIHFLYVSLFIVVLEFISFRDSLH